jgi:hypothetical protein
MLDHHARSLSIEMDRGIIWTMLEAKGWTRVAVSRLVDNQHAIDISDWISANCQDSCERNGREFLFKSQQDAVMFTLRWQS